MPQHLPPTASPRATVRSSSSQTCTHLLQPTPTPPHSLLQPLFLSPLPRGVAFIYSKSTLHRHLAPQRQTLSLLFSWEREFPSQPLLRPHHHLLGFAPPFTFPYQCPLRYPSCRNVTPLRLPLLPTTSSSAVPPKNPFTGLHTSSRPFRRRTRSQGRRAPLRRRRRYLGQTRRSVLSVWTT